MKPDRARLTPYYLSIALGGALGAVSVGLIAPRVFPGVYELPLSLVAVATLALVRTWSGGRAQRLLWGGVTLAMVAVLGAEVQGYRENALAGMRSFYGALRVTHSSVMGEEVRTLYHGTVQHGSQFVEPARRGEPTSYYGRESGAGLAIASFSGGPRRIGVIGLGAGTLAAYGRPGDVFRFYEINPQVIGLARFWFTYLRETPARVEVAQGDARLALEREPPQDFDVLVVDAFSGDAIPVHLLTAEAFSLYTRHLKPSGVAAFHLSNQYLNLVPVAVQLASRAGYRAVLIHSAGNGERLLSPATWVLATRNTAVLERPEIRQAARPPRPRPSLRPWTDDYNNLFDVLDSAGAAGAADR
jgi:spermidine synthase